MSILIKIALLFSISYSASANALGMTDIEAMNQFSKEYMALRKARWPEVYYLRTDPLYDPENELVLFRKNRYDKALRDASSSNNATDFFNVWNLLSETQKVFYATDYDISTGQSRMQYAAQAIKEERASERGDEASIVEALCKYVDEGEVDRQDYAGETALTLSLGVLQGSFNTARTLIESCGADVNLATKRGITPLMLAALWGNSNLFQFLIDSGADDTAVDLRGKGIYYYFNMGQFREVYAVGAESDQIKSWLEENGHHFSQEALPRCTGFQDSINIRSQLSRFVPSSESSENLSAEVGFQIDAEKKTAAKQILAEKLKEQCLAFGYTSCEINISDQLDAPPRIASERILLTGEPGVIYYALQKLNVVVMASSSGDPNDCSL